MVIRIRTRQMTYRANHIEMAAIRPLFLEIGRRVIRKEMGRSGSYADPPKHCYASFDRPVFPGRYR